MIRRLEAIEFQRRVGNGQSKPAFIVAETDAGDAIELVAKTAGGCMRGVSALAMELISTCLAADLGLRVPEPFFVNMSDTWIRTIPDQEWRELAFVSSTLAFGSRNITGGFIAWQPTRVLSAELASAVAAALAFDAAIENSDRRPENPNCLRREDIFFLIDHELCFPSVLFGQPKPWVIGGLQQFAQAGKQIFVDALRGKEVDWVPVVERWEGLSDAMIDGYGQLLPPEWAGAAPTVASAAIQIKRARDNISALVEEIERVLT
jgi:hypothetical protein